VQTAQITGKKFKTFLMNFRSLGTIHEAMKEINDRFCCDVKIVGCLCDGGVNSLGLFVDNIFDDAEKPQGLCSIINPRDIGHVEGENLKYFVSRAFALGLEPAPLTSIISLICDVDSEHYSSTMCMIPKAVNVSIGQEVVSIMFGVCLGNNGIPQVVWVAVHPFSPLPVEWNYLFTEKVE
jgi:hypothetical protein